jgi:hypothetical protein
MVFKKIIDSETTITDPMLILEVKFMGEFYFH